MAPTIQWTQQPTAKAASRLDVASVLVGGYVFFLPVQFAGSSTNFAPSDAFLGLYLLTQFHRLRFSRRCWGPFHFALIAAFWIGACVAVAGDNMLMRYVLVKVFGLLLLFASYLMLTSAASSWDSIRFLLRIFVVSATLQAALAIGAHVAGFRVPWINYDAERISGMLLDPNAFCGLLTMALVLHLVTFHSPQPLVRGARGVLSAIIISLALLLTLSRSAWIGLGFAILVALLFRPRLLAPYALACALAAGAGLLLLGSRNVSREVQLADRPNTAQQRIQQVQDALPMFATSPVFGIGIGGFSLATAKISSQPYIIHNTTVWMLTELGLVGVSAFLGFIAWFGVKGLEAWRFAAEPDKPVVLALMSAHAGMYGLSTGIEALYQRHWWMVMALLASAYAICCQQRRARS